MVQEKKSERATQRAMELISSDTLENSQFKDEKTFKRFVTDIQERGRRRILSANNPTPYLFSSNPVRASISKSA